MFGAQDDWSTSLSSSGQSSKGQEQGSVGGNRKDTGGAHDDAFGTAGSGIRKGGSMGSGVGVYSGGNRGGLGGQAPMERGPRIAVERRHRATHAR